MTHDTKEKIKAGIVLAAFIIIVFVVFVMVVGCKSSTATISQRAQQIQLEAEAQKDDAAVVAAVGDELATVEEVNPATGQPFLSDGDSPVREGHVDLITVRSDPGTGGGGAGRGAVRRGYGPGVDEGFEAPGLDRGDSGSGVPADLLRRGDSSVPGGGRWGDEALREAEGGGTGAHAEEAAGGDDLTSGVRSGGESGPEDRRGVSASEPGRDRDSIACWRCRNGWAWAIPYALALATGFVGYMVGKRK